MKQNQSSRTALLTTLVRAHHYAEPGPHIFVDPYAQSLFTDDERHAGMQALARLLSEADRATLGDPLDDTAAMRLCLKTLPFSGAILARARFAEDRFAEVLDNGMSQYVLIGAGFDTFAFRRPELQESVQVFEIDFPTSQSDKTQRLNAAGLTVPTNLHFVPVDLEHEDLAQSLSTSAFDTNQPGFFVWLGVTPYLRETTILRTLETISDVTSPNSQIVFDFLDRPGLDPATTSDRIRRFFEFVASMGEPALGALDANRIGPVLESVGYDLVEHLSPDAQEQRYFQHRSDGLSATEYYHFVCANVRD